MLNNKYVKNYDKNITLSYLMYLDGWVMSQKLLVNDFKWNKNVSKFDEDFIKNYDVDSNNVYILEQMLNIQKNLLNVYGDLPFLAERKKI